MRHFLLDGKLYDVRDGQYTADEISNNNLNAVACAPFGAIDVTEHAEDIKTYSGNHDLSIVDGSIHWSEREVYGKSLLEQLSDLDTLIPQHTRDRALLGDAIAIAKMQEAEDQKIELRKLL